MHTDPPSPYNTSLTGQFLWQVSRSREWAHPVGKVVFNSTEDGGCCCGVVDWTNAKAGAAAAARKQVVEAAEAPRVGNTPSGPDGGVVCVCSYTETDTLLHVFSVGTQA